MAGSRMIDEGPSPEDVARFGRGDDVGYCTACGAEVWDLAEVCPKCGELLPRGPARRPPVEQHFHRRWIILVVVLTLVAFLLLYLL